jgi:hypothetical protein
MRFTDTRTEEWLLYAELHQEENGARKSLRHRPPGPSGNRTRVPSVAGPEERHIATNKPIGDNARKRAVRKRSQLKVKVAGEDRWTKRDKGTGAFMAQKKTARKFKGVRRER